MLLLIKICLYNDTQQMITRISPAVEMHFLQDGRDERGTNDSLEKKELLPAW